MNSLVLRDLEEISKTFEQIVKHILRKVGISSPFEDKIQLKMAGGALIIVMPKYYKYVDSGRKVGSFPPIKPLMNWVTRYRISVPNGMTKKQFAYAIATNIKKRGIKPRPFIKRMRDALTEIIKDFIANKLKNIKIQ